ncbi:cation diffusion facilitator family transporter [Halorussus halobius]|uniref:cation diffusion facilitator family transporter n=1 Tax=Halorussus halobius TaxID=1710537 RepID=UPI0010928BE7|nr:cation diffusion facilitator family transporter [Halorussus halobius]
MAESKSVVMAALVANGAIAVLKFGGFLLTGSPAMLSETYHSISDTGNQVFLLIGIRYSNREASRGHPFGYGKAQFFYSFLVSVLLFGIAGWESAKHGYDAIMHPGHGGGTPVELLGFGPFDPVYVNYAVLLGAIAFETYALRKAWAGMKADIEQHEWSGLREAFRKTSNVTTLTAFTEDTIALVGAGLALAGVYLTRVTGNYIYDAVSALLIGIMLMGFALALAWENKRLLLGESLPKDEEQKLRTIVEEWDGVGRIVDFRTVYFGPEQVMLTADVAFENGLDTAGMDDRITAIEDALREANPSVNRVYVEPEARELSRTGGTAE